MRTDKKTPVSVGGDGEQQRRSVDKVDVLHIIEERYAAIRRIDKEEVPSETGQCGCCQRREVQP
ncbi:hypothetical protein [Acidisarcina polymorpha]|uniref:hypothetical protein n=1 Tax=Acidisarcina polymorpha TaxID=2211140 RepID=UPI001374FA7A|nr:hypothetical protein [Acidisarcina polymorpha]